jgi:hypothetical protein
MLYDYASNTFRFNILLANYMFSWKTDNQGFPAMAFSTDFLGATNTQIWDFTTMCSSGYDYEIYKDTLRQLHGVENPRIVFVERTLGSSSIYYGFSNLVIRNVWSRERLYVKSDLDRYHEYIGYTNSTYGPPKTYKINRGDDSFWIQLLDAANKMQVDFPHDFKDTLVIEAQLIAS